MKRNKSGVLKLISCMFAFFLTLLLLILYLLTGLCFGVFSNSNIRSKLNETDYYNRTYEELKKNTDHIAVNAGFPVTVLGNAINFDRFYIAGKNYMNNALCGKNTQVKTEKLRDIIAADVNSYLKQQGIARTDELNAGIDSLVTTVEKAYISSIELPFINYIEKYKVNYINWLRIAMPLIILLTGILCFYLIRIHHYKHRGLRYITYALIASSCITILSSLYLLGSKQYMKVDTARDYYRDFLMAYLKWDIRIFLCMGVIGLLLSAVLISFTGYMKSKKDDSWEMSKDE